jgi:hypothetical protein
LSWWEEASAEDPIDLNDWINLTDAESRLGPGKRPVFAIDASPKLRTAAIAMAGYRADGLIHLEVVKYENGVDWTVAAAVALKKKHRARIVMARNSPIASKLGDLQTAKVDPYLMTELETAAAFGLFSSDVDHEKIRHLGDPILLTALKGAVKKDAGDGGNKLSRKLSTDICPLYAAMEAAYCLVTLPPPVAVFASKV